MNSALKTIAATALGGLVSAAGIGGLAAQEIGPASRTIIPISGQGQVRDGRQFLLNLVVGGKQAVGYFLNEQGRCKLTLMVGEAFNGEDVPDLTTVRFTVAIDSAQSATFDTAEGKSLEFTCEAGAQEMSVKSQAQFASNQP